MSDHPIQGLMKTAMESLHGMVDVNTVIGDPVETPDGSVIVPVSRVAFGFAAGGGEYTRPGGPRNVERDNDDVFPFGGGSGAGVSVQPVGFLVVGHGQVRMLPVHGTQPLDRLIDMAPQLFDKIKAMAQNDRTHEHSMGSDREDHRTTMQ
jgi:sporulation protein YtfJ